MRAFLFELFPHDDRRQTLVANWEKLGGTFSDVLDRTVRYVLTDSLRPWQESSWKTAWNPMRVPIHGFYMVPAQWALDLTSLTTTTIPPYTIKPTRKESITVFKEEKMATSQPQPPPKRICCQYPDCSQQIAVNGYDEHLLEHLKTDRRIGCPDWRKLM